MGVRVERAGPLYANETNGVWSPVEGFSGTTGSQSSMNSVSCPLSGTAWRLARSATPSFPVLSSAAGAVETNGVWGPDTPDIGDTASATAPLVGVSCVAVGFCYAVGQDMFNQPYVTVYESGTWGNVKVISPVEDSTLSPGLVALHRTSARLLAMARTGSGPTTCGTPTPCRDHRHECRQLY